MFRARVFARTLLYVFLVTSTFLRYFFSNYVEDYLKVDKCIITHSGTRVQPVHVQYTYTYSKLHVQ